MRFNLRSHLLHGHVIPALPLALNRARRWDERHQRALVRYYVDAGAGGLAVGVHSTQFAIRDPAIGLYQPVVTLAAETARAALASAKSERTFVLIAGVCGRTPQARREARLARERGYHAALLSPHEHLSPAQADEITRVARTYPWLVDDVFVQRHLDRWLA